MVRLNFTLRFTLVVALLGSALLAAFLFGGTPGGTAAAQSSEYITTYAGDCATPQTIFYLGDTVCAEAGDFPVPLGTRVRRFLWRTPNSSVAAVTNIKVDPHFTKFVIPTSGNFAQTGTWHVRSINASAEGHASAKFVVRSHEFRLADLWISVKGPYEVLPGERLIYKVELGNPGPDFAEGVEFTTQAPEGMIFVALKQSSGPFFECSTPPRGGTGEILCQTKGLDLDENATFDLYYEVNPDLKEGTGISWASSVRSYYTEESNKEDNSWITKALVVSPDQGDGGGGGETEP